MIRMFIYPVLKLIYCSDPGKNGQYSFQLVFFSPFQIFFIVKEYIPVVHTKKFHGHTCHLSNFHWIFFKSCQRQIMGKEGMNSVTSFMYHSGYITHLTCSIHKNKRCSGLRQGTIITTRGLSFPAFQVYSPHLFLLCKAFPKEGIHLSKTLNG